jgi:hypothetical protein
MRPPSKGESGIRLKRFRKKPAYESASIRPLSYARAKK